MGLLGQSKWGPGGAFLVPSEEEDTLRVARWYDQLKSEKKETTTPYLHNKKKNKVDNVGYGIDGCDAIVRSMRLRSAHNGIAPFSSLSSLESKTSARPTIPSKKITREEDTTSQAATKESTHLQVRTKDVAMNKATEPQQPDPSILVSSNTGSPTTAASIEKQAKLILGPESRGAQLALSTPTGSPLAKIYHVPDQHSLSDTEFHFLISKLRGKQISALEWEAAVQQVQALSFGSCIKTAMAAETNGMVDGKSDQQDKDRESLRMLLIQSDDEL
ncbi:hypothetical protein GQ44DRAFT_727632 [Phaeosphaeriaceae sp. PMI808]|nr:hypothetical protein GQ44DRAFT_727632 [Phaeosphaeriaceae sp. PMI808]